MARRQTTVERDIPLFLIPLMIKRRIRVYGEETDRIIVRRVRSHYYNISIRTRTVKRELKVPAGSAAERGA